jgi:ribosomal protein S18 acetylase RimI-like enzyme
MVQLPPGIRLEMVCRGHPRASFDCGHDLVNEWLAKNALQNYQKRLSVTKVALDPSGSIAGFFTLATGQVDFGELPAALVKRLPHRALPVAVLGWLGVDRRYGGRGLGTRLVAQALADCFSAAQTFAFVAVLLDCVDERAKRFYQRWDFEELPGRPMRLFLSYATLAALMDAGPVVSPPRQ